VCAPPWSAAPHEGSSQASKTTTFTSSHSARPYPTKAVMQWEYTVMFNRAHTEICAYCDSVNSNTHTRVMKYCVQSSARWRNTKRQRCRTDQSPGARGSAGLQPEAAARPRPPPPRAHCIGPLKGRAASGRALAPEPLHATRSQPESRGAR